MLFYVVFLSGGFVVGVYAGFLAGVLRVFGLGFCDCVFVVWFVCTFFGFEVAFIVVVDKYARIGFCGCRLCCGLRVFVLCRMCFDLVFPFSGCLSVCCTV